MVRRLRLTPYARVAIQMGLAVAAAIAAGDALSGQRFYWAVIAVLVTFVGTHTTGEQVRKIFFRLAETLVGVFAGSALAHLVGDRAGVQIAVILLALFLGLYFSTCPTPAHGLDHHPHDPLYPTPAGNDPGQMPPDGEDGSPGTATGVNEYTRSASLFAHVARSLANQEPASPVQLALHDLQVLAAL
jgi:hypothetical protein